MCRPAESFVVVGVYNIDVIFIELISKAQPPSRKLRAPIAQRFAAKSSIVPFS